MRRWVIFVAAPFLAACTGGQSAPPQPRALARPAPAPAPYRPARAQAPAPVLQASPVVWLPRLADAQAQARASGRLILVGSTKPGCTLCEKFMQEIAPQCGGRLNQLAVAYVYDIERPESGRIDGTLRANLRGAVLMPLVGFVTADLAWVHGFAGPRTAQEFMGDIETAARLHPRRTAAVRSASGPALAHVSFVNEFGETEWSEPADAWPKPQDALGAQPVLAVVPPRATATSRAPVAASALSPEPSISAAPAVARGEPLAAEPLADAAGWSAPPGVVSAATTPEARIEAPPSVAPWPAVVALRPPQAAPAPEALPAPLPPLAPPAPAAIAAVPMDESAARARLGRAFDLIRQGQYDLARDELRRVSRSLPHTNLGREADRGGVAVYNARRISEANSQERPDMAAQARRALTGSMWVTLF